MGRWCGTASWYTTTCSEPSPNMCLPALSWSTQVPRRQMVHALTGEGRGLIPTADPSAACFWSPSNASSSARASLLARRHHPRENARAAFSFVAPFFMSLRRANEFSHFTLFALSGLRCESLHAAHMQKRIGHLAFLRHISFSKKTSVYYPPKKIRIYAKENKRKVINAAHATKTSS